MILPNLLDDFVSKENPNAPSDDDFIRYLFWEKGIGYTEFNQYPLPYIFNVLKTWQYINKEKEKQHKKQMQKNR